MPVTLPPRSAIPQSQTWDLASIFSTPAGWEEACNQLENLLPQLAAYQGRMAESPETLLAFLQLYEQAGTLMGKISTYASNAAAVDTGSQEDAAREDQARGLSARHAAAVSFLDPELVAIGFDKLHTWLAATPGLAYFDHYIERLKRRQSHVRSSEVEETLALSAAPFSGPYAVYSMLNNADLVFKPAVASDGTQMDVGQSSISGLLSHSDRAVRRSAWENYADGYLAHKNTFAAGLSAYVKQNVFIKRARRFQSCLHASLEPNFIPVEVFHNLIQVFQKNLPTWHKYWRVRRKALGYAQLHEYDIKAPLSESRPSVPYEQAVDWICAGMAPLGEEYVSILRRGCLDERWVDRACNVGKRQGAYSSGAYGTRPFILMSYADDLYSLSTLAHELGHSMHSYFSRQHQPFLYSRYGLFVAEVASNFNQAMVRDYLFRTQPGRDFQIALIEEAMSNYHRYFFIMPTLARFELEVHTRAEQGAPLSAGIMNDLVADLFSEGYGGELEFDRPRTGVTWAQFQHMYMNFYVYQYATGISGAHALAHRILDGVPGAVDAYLDFLKSGGSRFPLPALQLAGVDLTSPEPVERAFAVLAGLVDRLEMLVT